MTVILPTVVIGLLAPPFDDAIVFPESEGYFDFCIVRGGLSSDDEFSVTVTTTGGNAGNHDDKVHTYTCSATYIYSLSVDTITRAGL